MTEAPEPGCPAEYAWRLARARAEMARENCDLMLLDSGEILAWLTGYTVSETMYRAAFLPAAGAPWFVLRALDEAPCREGAWLTDVVGYPDMADPLAVMAQEITRRGFDRARIGLDLGAISMNPRRLAQLQAALPGARFVDLGPVSESLRWVKSEAEIALLARAATIADETMAELARTITAGDTTRDAAAVAAAGFLRRGADTGETGPILRAAGDHEFLHGLFRTEALAPGDILHVELIPRVANYGARLMRPVVIGGPSPAQAAVAARLVALQDAQIAAMRPGVPAREVDAILREGVRAEGLRAAYDNVTAYTLGLYVRTPRSSDFSRVFLPDADWPLEAGMVFHLYATAQGLGFSETVVVRPEGGERLTRTPRRVLAAGA